MSRTVTLGVDEVDQVDLADPCGAPWAHDLESLRETLNDVGNIVIGQAYCRAALREVDNRETSSGFQASSSRPRTAAAMPEEQTYPLSVVVAAAAVGFPSRRQQVQTRTGRTRLGRRWRYHPMSGFVHAAHQGDAYDWRGARVVIKASGEDTFGQLGVMECTYPAGLSVPTHFHAGEDEMFYVLGGELHGYCDNDHWTAVAGSFVFVPRDRPHGFLVVGDEPARALVIVGPSQLDRQVAATGTPVPNA